MKRKACKSIVELCVVGESLDRARIALRQGRPELAAKEARRELRAEPESPQAHALLAVCLAAMQDFDEALDLAKQSIQLSPDWYPAHLALARVYHRQKRYTLARDSYLEALRLAPDVVVNFAELAQLYVDQSRFEQALHASQKGLQLDPEHRRCLEFQAICHFELECMSEAKQASEKILQCDPNNATGHEILGWVLHDSGNIKQANVHFREAARIDPNWVGPRAGIADAIKYRNPLYRAYVWFQLSTSFKIRWTIRLSVTAVLSLALLWAVQVQGRDPLRQEYFLFPFAVFFVTGTLLSIGFPLFNILYWFDRSVRFGISAAQVNSSRVVLVFLLLTIAALGIWAIKPMLITLTAAGMIFGLAVPVCLIFEMPRGIQRRLMVSYTIAMGTMGAVGMFMFNSHSKLALLLCSAYFIAWAIAEIVAALIFSSFGRHLRGGESEMT